MQKSDLKRAPMDLALVKQLVEDDGGVVALISGLHRHQEISERMDREHTALLEQYAGNWVVMGEAGLLSVGTTLDEVLSVIGSRGLDTSEFVVSYLEPDPPVTLL